MGGLLQPKREMLREDEEEVVCLLPQQELGGDDAVIEMDQVSTLALVRDALVVWLSFTPCPTLHRSRSISMLSRRATLHSGA